jgi:hypothetical protein
MKFLFARFFDVLHEFPVHGACALRVFSARDTVSKAVANLFNAKNVPGRSDRPWVMLQADVSTQFDKLASADFRGHRIDEFVQLLALLLGQLELPFEPLRIALGLNLRFVRLDPARAEELLDHQRRIAYSGRELYAGKILKELSRAFVARMKATVEPSVIERFLGFDGLDKFACSSPQAVLDLLDSLLRYRCIGSEFFAVLFEVLLQDPIDIRFDGRFFGFSGYGHTHTPFLGFTDRLENQQRATKRGRIVKVRRLAAKAHQAVDLP